MTYPPIGPTAGRERLVHLDVLRGFALLGILIVNVAFFTQPITHVMLGADPGLAGADRVVDWWIKALFEGKFYALFSMLFGVGFALMFQRMEATGRKFFGLYFRRLLVLALFGLAHGILIWAGDILFVYALVGFLMMILFRRTPVRRLPKWALLFLVLPAILMWAFAIGFETSKSDPSAHEAFMTRIEQDHARLVAATAVGERVYSTGSWTETTQQRAGDMRFLLSQALFWVSPVLAYFLFGRWMLMSGRLRDPDSHDDFFRKLMLWGLVLGGILALGANRLIYEQSYAIPSFRMATGMTVLTAGAPLLMLGYASAVIRYRDRLMFLAPAGRMALTNYLVQSLVWTWVFYGHGLGLWGQVPRAWQPVLMIAFFALQVMFSRWWLDRYRFGPAEWLWRSLTYLKMQPMRRKGQDLRDASAPTG